MLVGRSYSINSQNNKDTHYDHNHSSYNDNNNHKCTMIPYKHQVTHSRSMDNIQGVYNQNECHNNTITVSDILKDPVCSKRLNNNNNQTSGCNSIAVNQHEYSNNGNNLNEESPRFSNECIQPSVLRNNNKRFLNRNVSSHTQSKKTFTFKPNDIDNSNSVNCSLDGKVINNYSDVQPFSIQQNEHVYKTQYNNPNQPSFTKPLNTSQQTASKPITPYIHKKVLNKSLSTHLLNDSTRYFNLYKDKLDLKTFERQFHRLKLASLQSKLKSLNNNISINPTINSHYSNYNISKSNSTLSSSQTQLNNYITQQRVKKTTQINLKRFNGMNGLFPKYVNTSSIMPPNGYSSVVQAKEYLFMND